MNKAVNSLSRIEVFGNYLLCGNGYVKHVVDLGHNGDDVKGVKYLIVNESSTALIIHVGMKVGEYFK